MLHRMHTCIATSRKEEGEPGHSILQYNVNDEEDPNCPDAKPRTRKHAGAAHMSCLTHAPVKNEEWEAWFCQFLDEPIPALEKLWRELTDHSVEQLSMRIVAEILLHLLCAQGLRGSDMLDSIKKIKNGKWEHLWGKVIKASNKLSAREEPTPLCTTKQKESYSQKRAKAGDYSKANQVICNEMLHACSDDTLEKLRLHPEKDLNFDHTLSAGPYFERGICSLVAVGNLGETEVQQHLLHGRCMKSKMKSYKYRGRQPVRTVPSASRFCNTTSE